MRYFNVLCFFHGFRIHAKSMVLRCYFTFACQKIFYRMIKAPVTVMKLIRGYIICQSEQLVAKANTKDGFVFLENFFQYIYSISHGSGITRAIGNKITAWI